MTVTSIIILALFVLVCTYLIVSETSSTKSVMEYDLPRRRRQMIVFVSIPNGCSSDLEPKIKVRKEVRGRTEVAAVIILEPLLAGPGLEPN